jgi:hypothetical protein
MSNIKLTYSVDGANPNFGDLSLDDSGQIEWVGMDPSDAEDYARMILQRIECNLRFIRGEWYLDQRQGTPWREKVWVKNPDLKVIRRIVRDVIEHTPGVDSIDTLSLIFDRSSRMLTISFVGVADTGALISTDVLDQPLIVEIPNG